MEAALTLHFGFFDSSTIAGRVVWERVSTPSISQIRLMWLKMVNCTSISSSLSNCKNLGRICSDVFFFPTTGHKNKRDLARESECKTEYFSRRSGCQKESISKQAKFCCLHLQNRRTSSATSIWGKICFLFLVRYLWYILQHKWEKAWIFRWNPGFMLKCPSLKLVNIWLSKGIGKKSNWNKVEGIHYFSE